jgi:hypothetical protein
MVIFTIGRRSYQELFGRFRFCFGNPAFASNLQ